MRVGKKFSHFSRRRISSLRTLGAHRVGNLQGVGVLMRVAGGDILGGDWPPTTLKREREVSVFTCFIFIYIFLCYVDMLYTHIEAHLTMASKVGFAGLF